MMTQLFLRTRGYYVLIFLVIASGLISCKQKNKEKVSSNTQDPLAAKTNASQGLCSGLHTATLSTMDLDKIKRFYVDGMGMILDGPFELSSEEVQEQNDRWGIPSDRPYKLYHLYRENIPALIQLRVIHLEQPSPSIHASYSSLELGPFSLGFPNLNQKKLDKKLRDLGIQAMADMQEGTIPRPDGTTYRYWETIFKGPDFLHVVGIERGDGMAQLAPCDSLTQLGGPGYSAQVLKDSDKDLAFYTEVLDMELRADRQWDTSPGSALGLEEGIPFRFALVYAKGSAHNHLLFLDFFETEMIDPGVQPKVPNLGLGMWTFSTTDIDEVKRRAESQEVRIISDIHSIKDSILGDCKILTMLAPNGFLIEIFQPEK